MTGRKHKQAEIDAFMRGARMGYEDCAKFAIHLASKADGFVQFTEGHSAFSPEQAQMTAGLAKTICQSLAESYLAKIKEMEAVAQGLENGIQ